MVNSIQRSMLVDSKASTFVRWIYCMTVVRSGQIKLPGLIGTEMHHMSFWRGNFILFVFVQLSATKSAACIVKNIFRFHIIDLCLAVDSAQLIKFC